jgi:hypothetical protein
VSNDPDFPFVSFFMSSPILEVAMSYVHSAASELKDEVALQEIRAAFSSLLSNQIPPDRVASLLDQYAISHQPLDRIVAILQTTEAPPPDTYQDRPSAGFPFSRRKPRLWSPTEDIRLLAAIRRFGVDNWCAVATFVGNRRSRAQCAQRWIRGLDPRIRKDQWSLEEEQRLIQLVREEGGKGWSKIAVGIGNRSDVQCRYHFFQMHRDDRLPPDCEQFAMADSGNPAGFSRNRAEIRGPSALVRRFLM